MVEISALHPGDHVRIVDHWPDDGSAYQNPEGGMDKWLGQIMTVKSAYPGHYAEMYEDDGEFCGGGWDWFPAAIDCVVSDADDFSPAAEEDLLALLSPSS